MQIWAFGPTGTVTVELTNGVTFQNAAVSGDLFPPCVIKEFSRTRISIAQISRTPHDPDTDHLYIATGFDAPPRTSFSIKLRCTDGGLLSVDALGNGGFRRCDDSQPVTIPVFSAGGGLFFGSEEEAVELIPALRIGQEYGDRGREGTA